MVLTITLLSQLAAAGVAAGVAASSPHGGLCVAIAGPALAPGTPLTLILPGTPQAVHVSDILGPIADCEPLVRAMIPGPYHRARRPTTMDSETRGPWVAFVGTLNTHTSADGVIEARLSAAHARAQVRSCTSGEGVHLTVWSGAPLTSTRLWHQYYYLRHDVEPSCDDRDTRPGPG